MTRTCPDCKIEKPATAFYKRAIVYRRPSGLSVYCIDCSRGRQVAANKKFRAKNPGHASARIAAKRADPAYRQREQERSRASYAASPKRKDAAREWFRAHPDARRKTKEKSPWVSRAILARYRAAMLQAMPSWADREQIKEVYKIADVLAGECGETLHVDHIIPLQGKNVSGLHVPWNLQVLTAFHNRSKGNRLHADLAA